MFTAILTAMLLTTPNSVTAGVGHCYGGIGVAYQRAVERRVILGLAMGAWVADEVGPLRTAALFGRVAIAEPDPRSRAYVAMWIAPAWRFATEVVYGIGGGIGVDHVWGKHLYGHFDGGVIVSSFLGMMRSDLAVSAGIGIAF